MMKRKYTAPVIERIRVEIECLIEPISVTENGQTSPDMSIGGDSDGGMEADSKRGFFYDYQDGTEAQNLWDD